MLLKIGLSAKPGKESDDVKEFLEKMLHLAGRAGGDAPKPARPDTASLHEIRLTAGNEQLLALYNQRDELASSIENWTDLAQRIAKRLPNWSILTRLMAHATGLQDFQCHPSPGEYH